MTARAIAAGRRAPNLPGLVQPGRTRHKHHRHRRPACHAAALPRRPGPAVGGHQKHGAMSSILSISGVEKHYGSGLTALAGVDLEVRRGEIFALLGPNGAGKTTLISIVCGTVTKSSGTVLVAGRDIVTEFRATRSTIGLVPQEIALDIFSTVWNTVKFSRGLFGRAPDPAYVEQLLRDLSLWDKRDSKTIELSGGMKRRVMIAKALSHEPELLFLDEPTAGVDVNLRRDMWALVRRLRDRGVTIVLTTHYIEEAEEMADRVGVIDRGRILLVEDTGALMEKMGKRRLTLALQQPMAAIPPELRDWPLELQADGQRLLYTIDAHAEGAGIPALLRRLGELGIGFKDLETTRSSLEDIFVSLVERG
jgi:ABC-2 type transport system ATP-binding protein